MILDEDEVRAIVAAAYEISHAFGMMVEVAAVTGGRASQIAPLEVRDLQADRAPRLMMPSSRKGKPRIEQHACNRGVATGLSTVRARRRDRQNRRSFGYPRSSSLHRSWRSRHCWPYRSVSKPSNKPASSHSMTFVGSCK